MDRLTKAEENYIKTIYALSSTEEGAHISDIAAKLDVTKASTSVAVKSLQRKAFVRRDAERLVYLTDEGRRMAILILNKFSIIREFLTGTLHVDPPTAHIEACAMEHFVSQETLCALCRFINWRACHNECTVAQNQPTEAQHSFAQ